MICQCEVHIWVVLRTCCCGVVNVLEVAVRCHEVYDRCLIYVHDFVIQVRRSHIDIYIDFYVSFEIIFAYELISVGFTL